VQFIFNGGVLLKNSEYREVVERQILADFPNAILTPLSRPSTWGAVELGKRLTECAEDGGGVPQDHLSPADDPETIPPVWHPAEVSPTEQRNPKSEKLSELSLREAIELFTEEDKLIPEAILKASEAIEWTINEVVEAFAGEGRLIYTGAGTSGRLGVLDASECPPTFRVSPEQVQGVIAGGSSALWSAAEGAEDDAAAGARAISFRNVGEKDVVMAISASGHAPFIWGCLTEAKKRGAKTVLMTCHPAYADHPLPDQVIVLEISNLMVDLNPSNTKLRKRAAGIVSTLAEVSEKEAHQALRSSGWVVREALATLEEGKKS